jgi:hypothetical protein
MPVVKLSSSEPKTAITRAPSSDTDSLHEEWLDITSDKSLEGFVQEHEMNSQDSDQHYSPLCPY